MTHRTSAASHRSSKRCVPRFVDVKLGNVRVSGLDRLDRKHAEVKRSMRTWTHSSLGHSCFAMNDRRCDGGYLSRPSRFASTVLCVLALLSSLENFRNFSTHGDIALCPRRNNTRPITAPPKQHKACALGAVTPRCLDLHPRTQSNGDARKRATTIIVFALSSHRARQ